MIGSTRGSSIKKTTLKHILILYFWIGVMLLYLLISKILVFSIALDSVFFDNVLEALSDSFYNKKWEFITDILSLILPMILIELLYKGRSVIGEGGGHKFLLVYLVLVSFMTQGISGISIVSSSMVIFSLSSLNGADIRIKSSRQVLFSGVLFGSTIILMGWEMIMISPLMIITYFSNRVAGAKEFTMLLFAIIVPTLIDLWCDWFLDSYSSKIALENFQNFSKFSLSSIVLNFEYIRLSLFLILSLLVLKKIKISIVSSMSLNTQLYSTISYVVILSFLGVVLYGEAVFNTLLIMGLLFLLKPLYAYGIRNMFLIKTVIFLLLIDEFLRTFNIYSTITL